MPLRHVMPLRRHVMPLRRALARRLLRRRRCCRPCRLIRRTLVRAGCRRGAARREDGGREVEKVWEVEPNAAVVARAELALCRASVGARS
eukprot:5239980-Prymnesium_polylepis.1